MSHSYSTGPCPPAPHTEELPPSVVVVPDSEAAAGVQVSQVGDLGEVDLEELASRLVADALSRAVEQCYVEKSRDSGRQVR